MVNSTQLFCGFFETPADKSKLTEDLERDKRIFFSMGGKVQQVPYGVTGAVDFVPYQNASKKKRAEIEYSAKQRKARLEQ